MTFTSRLDAVLADLLAYSSAIGKKPETVVQYATRNTRLLPAMRRRAALLDSDLELIRQYIEAHPPNAPAENQDTQTSTQN